MRNVEIVGGRIFQGREGGGLRIHTNRVQVRFNGRDLATMVVAVSDTSATNGLIDRVGMEYVNRLLDRLGLKQSRLRRKMMDLKGAQEGRENVSTPREMMLLLEAIDNRKVLNKSATEDFLRISWTHKDSTLLRGR